MSKNLVIVESPAKAKTIQKFIGKDYDVISSKGHVRDLPQKDLGIDISKNFSPQYVILDDKKHLITDIKKMADQADTVWLATDDDREGEAISWHLMESAKINPEKVKRIVFHEITKSAIDNALSHPRDIDIDLVNAQQARRILDRLVGFELSPVLWRKVKPQLSAGRVQSVAVRLIVDREHEIQTFQSHFAFKVSGIFASEENAQKTLQADLDKKYDSLQEAELLMEDCKGKQFTVAAIEKSPGKKTPAAPFTTSTLQQEAARKLSFSVSKTMMVAQQLYEAGYITYMRTDSVNLSSLALNDIKNQIVEQYGEEYYKSRQYQTKSKNAQEAHEAIRPTNMANQTVPMDTFAKRLYELIWKRSIACQMSDAKIEKTTITLPVPKRAENFIATGEVVLFQGFLKVYIESKDEEDEENHSSLPVVKKGEIFDYEEIKAVQKYAQPPARFTEASLVKKLEELGIGRPSTYAPIISTIVKRNYVVSESRSGSEREITQLLLKKDKLKTETKKERFGSEKDKLFPTDIGMVVSEYLQQNFQDIMDYSFTAEVEKKFDDIAEGKLQWQKMIDSFYNPFHISVDDALVHSTRASGERNLGIDPKSKKNVIAKLGKYGPMVQIGDNSEDEKPRYARLKPAQSIDFITLEEALDLFQLPRTVGKYNDEDIVIGIGRFGHYIKYGNNFVSLPKTEDPLEINEKTCIDLIEQKKKLEADRAPRVLGLHDGKEIAVAAGRYGPYLKYDEKNTTLPKGTNVASLTLEQAIEILTNTKDKAALKTFKENENVKVMNGRYGAYITDGKNNFKIPKGSIPENLTYEETMNIIQNTTPTAKKRTFKKK